MARALFIGVGLVLLLSLLPHGVSQGFALQNQNRRKKRTPVQPQVREVQTVAGASDEWLGQISNPLTLVVTVKEDRTVYLNKDAEGTLGDLSTLRRRLENLFEQRRQMGAFRPGTSEVEKLLVVKSFPYLREDELAKVVAEVKAAGAEPVQVMTEEQYQAALNYWKVRLAPPKPVSAEERKRIQSMGPINGGVLNGKAISLPKPVTPARVRVKATVTVQIVVDEEGKVISARAVSGHPSLHAAAVQAARQARFSRTLLSGVPVKVSGVVVYHFNQ